MVKSPAILAMSGHGILKTAKIRQAVMAEKFQQLEGLLLIDRPEQLLGTFAY